MDEIQIRSLERHARTSYMNYFARMASWYHSSVKNFLEVSIPTIVGVLSSASADRDQAANPQQMEAWRTSLEFLSEVFRHADGSDDWGILLEYEIPRRGRRPDAVVLVKDTIFVVEFKCGSASFDRAALLQASAYAKDLRDFHAGSATRRIVPVVVATGYTDTAHARTLPDCLMPVHCIGSTADLVALLLEAVSEGAEQIIPAKWDSANYQPTPDILSAAREVFAGHSVEAISFAHADNLDGTVKCIRDVIASAREHHRHIAVFVTGVPGSGKTLAGLSAVHQTTDNPGAGSEPLGAYLSGNGPLISVLRYALTCDKAKRDGISKSAAALVAETFIQPVHHFVREYASIERVPPDHVIVFDEAQRAWDKARMRQKQGIERSEAEVVVDAMERVPEWSVIVALVGEGQEINNGEAGLGEWAKALAVRDQWEVLVAPDLIERFSTTGAKVDSRPALHLSVSVRSPRAHAIANWADAVVNGRLADGSQIIQQFPEYPIYLTRSLEDMRSWLRDIASTGERVGLLASSQARRLRAFGLETGDAAQGGSDWPKWFVEPYPDIRSSTVLEVAASEFKCQGLEIDWVGLCWGQDFNWTEDKNDWTGRRLSGSKWTHDSDMTFARNRYRVLLTRARFGMVIWVPQPSGHEPLVSRDIASVNEQALLAAGASPLQTA